MEQCDSSENMSVCDVLNVREVEHVVVFTDLELGLSCLVRVDYLREQLYIAFAEDTGRADGAGQEARVVFRAAVGLEDSCLCVCLRTRSAKKTR